jgi:hypothetical protein
VTCVFVSSGREGPPASPLLPESKPVQSCKDTCHAVRLTFNETAVIKLRVRFHNWQWDQITAYISPLFLKLIKFQYMMSICSLFNDAFQWLRLYSVEWNDDSWMMNWKVCGRKRSWHNLMYYSGICLEGLTKPTKNLSQDSRYPGRNFIPAPSEYDAGVLTTRPWRSLCDVRRVGFYTCCYQKDTLRQFYIWRLCLNITCFRVI